jgi:hypothetical protein
MILRQHVRSQAVLTHLGHHASPCNNIGVYLFACLLLMSSDGLEKAIEMVISGVIQLLKSFESLGEVCA